MVRDVCDLFNEDTVPKDAVFRDVRPDIDVMSQRRQAWIACVADADQRTRLGVSLTKAKKVERVSFWQDRKVALQLAGREPRRMTCVGAASDRRADISRRSGLQIGMRGGVDVHQGGFQQTQGASHTTELSCKLSF